MHGLESRLSEDHISTQLQQYKYEHVFTSITRVFQLAYGLSAGRLLLDPVSWTLSCNKPGSTDAVSTGFSVLP